MIRPPSKRPCPSCPYRRDVPSGVWSEDEYAKLPEYDRPLAEQPPSIFLCHQQNERLCAGWVACHDMNESFGLRMAISREMIDPDDLDEIFDYTTMTPLFTTGAEAAAHGLEEVSSPGERARRTIDKLTAKVARE